MQISLFKVLAHGIAGMLLLAVSLFSFNALALPTIEEYGARVDFACGNFSERTFNCLPQRGR